MIGGKYVGKNSLASNRTAAILEKDSPLLKQMETRAKQNANAMGLANSTMALSAGLDSTAAVAGDLGKHEAEMYGSSQRLAQQRDNNLAAIHAQAQESRETQAEKYEQEKGLVEQAADIKMSQMERQHLFNKNLANWQNRLDARTLAQQQKFQREMAEAGFEQAKITSMATMVNDQTNTLMREVGRLLNNTEIEVTDSTIKWMSDFQNSSWESAAALLGVDIDVS